jgi:hypothetical protein
MLQILQCVTRYYIKTTKHQQQVYLTEVLPFFIYINIFVIV